MKENIINNTFKDLHKNGTAILENKLAVSYKLKYTSEENDVILCDLGLDTIS